MKSNTIIAEFQAVGGCPKISSYSALNRHTGYRRCIPKPYLEQMKVQIFMFSNIYVNMSEFSEYHIARAHDKKIWQAFERYRLVFLMESCILKANVSVLIQWADYTQFQQTNTIIRH